MINQFIDLVLLIISNCINILDKDYFQCGVSVFYLLLGVIVISSFVKLFMQSFGLGSSKVDFFSSMSNSGFIDNNSRESQLSKEHKNILVVDNDTGEVIS